ncbi:MAG: hypothetical protein ABJK28_05770 [Algibacter sp.]
MNISNILKIIDDHNFETNFLFDELGYTWQASYIRIIGGTKKIYKSAEYFYLSIIKAPEVNANLTYGLAYWPYRFHLEEWAVGLIIEKINTSDFEEDLKKSLDEIELYKNDWIKENTQKFNQDKIIKPQEIINYWKIEETIYPRIKTGGTIGLLAEFRDSYFYFEHHIES